MSETMLASVGHSFRPSRRSWLPAKRITKKNEFKLIEAND
jgi:hypothetical protein